MALAFIFIGRGNRTPSKSVYARIPKIKQNLLGLQLGKPVGLRLPNLIVNRKLPNMCLDVVQKEHKNCFLLKSKSTRILSLIRSAAAVQP